MILNYQYMREFIDEQGNVCDNKTRPQENKT